MNTCHILLGYSWKYDVHAIHKGRDNTYEFLWIGKKIVLLLLTTTLDKKLKTDQKQALFTVLGPKEFNLEGIKELCAIVKTRKQKAHTEGESALWSMRYWTHTL